MANAAMIGLYLILANRSHYTVDVVIAIYMAFFVDFFVQTKRLEPRIHGSAEVTRVNPLNPE
jgi:hypothetical protein